MCMSILHAKHVCRFRHFSITVNSVRFLGVISLQTSESVCYLLDCRLTMVNRIRTILMLQAGHSQFQLSDNVFKIQSSVPLVHCTMQTTKSML